MRYVDTLKVREYGKPIKIMIWFCLNTQPNIVNISHIGSNHSVLGFICKFSAKKPCVFVFLWSCTMPQCKSEWCFRLHLWFPIFVSISARQQYNYDRTRQCHKGSVKLTSELCFLQNKSQSSLCRGSETFGEEGSWQTIILDYPTLSARA